MRHSLAPCIALLLLLSAFVRGQDDDLQVAAPVLESAPVFASDIVPLLKKHCWKCHSAQSPKGELSLQTLNGFLLGGESGQPAIVPGNPAESPLMRLVDNGEMPPGNASLNQAERDLLRHWIATGASGQKNNRLVLSQAQLLARRVHFLVEIKCQPCHGRAKQEANLDLRTVASAIKGGKSGPALVRGDANESLLVKRVSADQMPPRNVRYKLSIKPVNETELEMIRQWIDDGAIDPPSPPGVIDDDGLLVDDQDKQWWSFQSPHLPEIPRPNGLESNHPIDTFLVDKLRQKELRYSPQADRRTLIRRLSVDLAGLIPNTEQTKAFVENTSPNAYDQLVDRLLSSPRYGERWAQHWLDAAGYADSEGSAGADQIWPLVYQYRDYVVRSLNSDKPYDRFLLEQLAGDQLANYNQLNQMTPELRDNLIATGYLRTCIDPTTSPETNFLIDRYQVLADTVEIVSSSLMGLTMRCARCHSHKYDPIPIRDYYRFTAIFATSYSPYEWVKPQQRYVTLAGKQECEEITSFNARIKDQIHPLQLELTALRKSHGERFLQSKLAEIPEAERAPLQQSLETAVDQRTEDQQKLIDDARKTFLSDDQPLLEKDAEYRQAKESLVQQKEALEKQLRSEVKAHGLSDMRSEPDPFYMLRRGEWHNRGRQVLPNVPAVLKKKIDEFTIEKPYNQGIASGTRLALARWLTRPDHPLTARVLVNRAWQHFFGTGIVSTAGDFGQTGTPPSHAELLDWLAVKFVRQGWSMKQLHRLIVTSRAYQQHSQSRQPGSEVDPDNRLLWKMPMRRMDAETLRDSLLSLTGQLNHQMYGSAAEVKRGIDGQVLYGHGGQSELRSIYLLHRRSTPLTLLETFDAPRMNTNCIQRRNSTVVSQALLMLNSGFCEQQAAILAGQILDGNVSTPNSQLQAAYQAVLGRAPTGAESQLGIEFLKSQRKGYQTFPQSTAATGVKSVLGMHANKGITFDLNAVREAHPQAKLTRLKGIAAMGFSATAAGDAHWYVIVDANLRAKGHLRNNDFAHLQVDLDGQARFLTLVTSSNGTLNTDWTFFKNAHFVLENNRNSDQLLDLADVVGGGDGFGTGNQTGLDPWTGLVVHEKAAGTNGQANQVHPVPQSPLIDCVFVPNGSANGQRMIPISTTGLEINGISAGAGNHTFCHIWNGHNRGVNGLKDVEIVVDDPALVDLCLVLLNSAEFLYID